MTEGADTLEVTSPITEITTPPVTVVTPKPKSVYVPRNPKFAPEVLDWMKIMNTRNELSKQKKENKNKPKK